MRVEDRNAALAFRRGWRGRCPRCGEGPLFDGYLALRDRCPACGEAVGEYRAADGPAFFTICIVGFLLVPAMGFGFVIFRPDPILLLLALTVGFTGLTLVLLRFVKGAFVGYLWAHGERDPGA